MFQSQEETVFNDSDAEQMALGKSTDEGLSVRFRMEEKLSAIKSEGGIVRYDRWKDSENIDRMKSQLDELGIKYKEHLNERDDTIDLKVEGAGRPIYDQVEYIEILSGDKTDIKDRPVSKRDKIRFARRYKAWKAGKSTHAAGLPLSQWPGITKSMINDLANHGIATVEQLAALGDETLTRIGPLQHLKQRAKDYLEQSRGLAPLTQMRAENAELRGQLETMQAQMQQLLAAQANQTVSSAGSGPEAAKPRRKRKEQHHGEVRDEDATGS